MKNNEIGFELNLDGLVGPTHHYAGLAKGNIASTTNAYKTANPAAAALQGIAKMRFLHQLGVPQAVLPPQERPNLQLLYQLGFKGTPSQQIHAAYKTEPKILMASFSASSMWTANCATISPSTDSQDGLLHFTPANLISQLHRSQETNQSARVLQKIFSDERYFKHHPPLPSTLITSDEGAANHNRICQQHGAPGLHVFVYGRHAWSDMTQAPTRFPARQTLEASQAVARLHQLKPKQTLFVRQNPLAIDQGVFHHDVIGVINESVILLHKEAFFEQEEIITQIKNLINFPLHIIEVSRQEFTLQDAVESYIFNSQLITLTTSNKMLLVAPKECESHPRVRPWINQLLSDSTNPIQQVHFFDLKQSMQNGGGPACLRLRVPIQADELKAMHQPMLMNEDKLTELELWVSRHYRNQLEMKDLLDPNLIDEVHRALDELTQILQLGSIYSFQ